MTIPKLFTVAMIVLLTACNTEVKKPVKEQPTKPDSTLLASTKLDDATISLTRSISFLDSNLKYYHLGQEMKLKMAQAEADYYRTGEDKYSNLYYRHQKKFLEYARLCNRYKDSLNVTSKR